MKSSLFVSVCVFACIFLLDLQAFGAPKKMNLEGYVMLKSTMTRTSITLAQYSVNSISVRYKGQIAYLAKNSKAKVEKIDALLRRSGPTAVLSLSSKMGKTTLEMKSQTFSEAMPMGTRLSLAAQTIGQSCHTIDHGHGNTETHCTSILVSTGRSELTVTKVGL
jgi:hypothetical protein